MTIRVFIDSRQRKIRSIRVIRVCKFYESFSENFTSISNNPHWEFKTKKRVNHF